MIPSWILKPIEDYLSTKSGKSSLRLNVTTMVQTANVCIFLLTIVVCFKIVKGTLTDPIGIAAIYGVLVGYALSALWGKNTGKEKENGSN